MENGRSTRKRKKNIRKCEERERKKEEENKRWMKKAKEARTERGVGCD